MRRAAGLFCLACTFGGALIITAASAASSEFGIYSFTDEKGVTYYTNMPSDPRFELLPSTQPPRMLTGEGRIRPYEKAIAEAALKHDVDVNLLRAVIKCESNFNHLAISRAGAQGLMQLMPETARLVDVSNPFNAMENLEGGTRYLKYLLDSFGDTKLALAAYNAGEGAVRRYGGVPPYAETKAYVAAVLDYYARYSSLGGGDVITSADIEAFVNSEGVRLFTNTPWKYQKGDSWRRMKTQ